MTNNVKISCIVDTTNPAAALGFKMLIDDRQFFNTDHVQTQQEITIEIPDDEAEHELKFILKNKTTEHTQVDAAGNVVADSRLIITDIAFEDVPLGHVVSEEAVYTHDFNGNGSTVQEKFFEDMGCNGVVSIKFTTPMYLWLLEHL